MSMKPNSFNVPHAAKPVAADVFERDYMGDYRRVADWLGPLMLQNVWHGNLTLSHQFLVSWLGSYAMLAVTDSSYRAWSTGDARGLSEPWARLVWRYVLLLPVGYLVSNHRIGHEVSFSAWHPALLPFSQFSRGQSLKAHASNRPLCGSAISLMLYQRLFPCDDAADPSLMLALADAMSPSPNADNPLVFALRRAVRRSLFRRPYPIPYFYREMLEVLFASSPSDLMQLRMLATNATPGEHPQYFSEIADRVAQDFEPQPHSQPQPPQSLTDPPTASTQPVTAEPPAPVSPRPSSPGTVTDAGGAPLLPVPTVDAVAPVNTVPSPSQDAHALDLETGREPVPPLMPQPPLTLRELVAQRIADALQRAADGVEPINAPRALLHVVEGQLCLAHPAWLSALFAGDAVEPAAINAAFVNEFGAIRRARIQRAGSLKAIPVTFAAVHPQWASVSLPALTAFSNNPDIQFGVEGA